MRELESTLENNIDNYLDPKPYVKKMAQSMSKRAQQAAFYVFCSGSRVSLYNRPTAPAAAAQAWAAVAGEVALGAAAF